MEKIAFSLMTVSVELAAAAAAMYLAIVFTQLTVNRLCKAYNLFSEFMGRDSNVLHDIH